SVQPRLAGGVIHSLSECLSSPILAVLGRGPTACIHLERDRRGTSRSWLSKQAHRHSILADIVCRSIRIASPRTLYSHTPPTSNSPTMTRETTRIIRPPRPPAGAAPAAP